MQMLAHVSIFNLVNLYNKQNPSDESIKFKEEQSFGALMSHEVCSDALDIHRLLYHFDLRGAVLTVPNTGLDSSRYLKAMKEQLEYWSKSGTEYRDHACDKCLYVSDENKAIRACVTDGVTIGHWCCSASSDQLKKIAKLSNSPMPDGPCLNPLTSIHDRLCETHQRILKDQCVVQPCIRPRRPDYDTCNDSEHIAISNQFHHRKRQNFTMASKLSRPGAKLPTDPSVHQNCWTAELDESTLVDVDEFDRAHEAGRYGGQDIDNNPEDIGNQTNHNKGRKPCMSRCPTHNDQLIVSTCGIILARSTFFRAEAPSAVKQFILDSFPERLPNLIFYDNACNLVHHIWSNPKDAEAFKDVVIPVDVFHMCSHKESDQFCQEFTNPNKIPDLKKGGKWMFNSSAAELTNIWRWSDYEMDGWRKS
ncbi:uncharacterized protein MELLADRAFT_85963 [Melampsora larici-populina 98AG31]|uniref:CxC6 like cysteine cluster associated with KDZ domain-containing protein n=1 Tax=Melampsora larici-populina (strain 98AG31 / pathotype 3-4-7) TaxID=747676 RepID=F4RKA7_MELLP|nr:uncharacterized protein MELLADRAFT_85963 [Melampsora larici-populina 98AG31]EGG07061.1 hypothetical protein MELLADRAFT_85963 [Melampsora larici-populina 98AG31]